MLDISLKPEGLFSIGPLPITNTMLSLFIVFVVLTVSFLILVPKFRVYKPTKIQVLFEIVFEMLGNIFSDITRTAYKSSLLFSFVLSFFVFILFSNWFGLIPLVGPLGIVKSDSNNVSNISQQESSSVSLASCLKDRDCILTWDFNLIKTSHFVPLLRAPTSDLSFTLVLALLSVITTNALGVRTLGIGYFKKYINVSNGIDFIVGILELISELGKIISFSFRLFGNVFAGEVLLVVIGFISYGVASLPFMGLELFLGMIQALVFFMLTTVFVSLAKSQHH